MNNQLSILVGKVVEERPLGTSTPHLQSNMRTKTIQVIKYQYCNLTP